MDDDAAYDDAMEGFEGDVNEDDVNEDDVNEDDVNEDDMEELKRLGVGALFAPGTTTTEIANYIKDWVKENRSF